jgi:hypothetical protein
MKTFTVDMICKVRKSVTCECENKEQAQNNPWEYAVDEREIDQIDYEVVNVSED